MTAKSNLLNGAVGTLTTTNGGGPDNFDSVTGASGTTLFLDTTLPFLDGGNALQVAAASPTPTYASWTGLGASTLNGRVAFAISDLPSANLPFLRFANPSNGGTARLVVNSSGKLVLQHGANVTGQTSATVLARNTWYQVDVQVVGSTTNASTVVRLYSGDGSTLLETISDTGISGLASATIDRIDIGFGGSNPTSTTPMWLARAAIADTGWIGPYVASAPDSGYEPHLWGLNYNGDVASGPGKLDGYLTLKSRWGLSAFGRLREYGDLNDLLPSNILTEHNAGTIIHWSARLRRSGSGMLPYTSISTYKSDIQALADQVCGLTFGGGHAPYIVIIFQHEPDAKTAQKSGTDAQFITAHHFFWDTFSARCVANGKAASFVGPAGKVRRGWCPTGFGFTAGSAPGNGIAVTTLHPGDDYVDHNCADPYRMEDDSNTDGTGGVTYNQAKRSASKDIVWICKQVVSWLQNNGHTQPLTFTEINFHEDLSIPASGGTAPSWNHAGLPAHTGVTTYKAGKWDDYNNWRKTEPMVVGTIPFNASLVAGREDFHIDSTRWLNTHNKLEALFTASTFQAPVARFTLTPTSGDTTTSFTVDASTSTDPASGTLTRTVDWGDGTVTSSAGIATTATHTYSRGGPFTIRVTVTSSASGLQGSATRPVTISAPSVLPPTSVTGALATTNNSSVATLTIQEPADTQRSGVQVYKDVDPNNDLPSVPYASLGAGTQDVTTITWTDPVAYRPDDQHYYVVVNVGADGVTLSDQMSVILIAPPPSSNSPVAVLAIAPTSAQLPASGSGVVIGADGGGSSSPLGYTLLYTFSADDGFVTGPSSASSTTRTIYQPGIYVFRLVVDDGHGGTDEDSATVTITATGGDVTPNAGLDRFIAGEPFAPYTDPAAAMFWRKRQRSQDKVDAILGGLVDPTSPAESDNPSTNILIQKLGILGLRVRMSASEDDFPGFIVEDRGKAAAFWVAKFTGTFVNDVLSNAYVSATQSVPKKQHSSTIYQFWSHGDMWSSVGDGPPGNMAPWIVACHEAYNADRSLQLGGWSDANGTGQSVPAVVELDQFTTKTGLRGAILVTKIAAGGNATPCTLGGLFGIPVTAAVAYRALVKVQAATLASSRASSIFVSWYNSSGTFLSSSTAGALTLTSGAATPTLAGWQTAVTPAVTSPAGAAFAQICFSAPTAAGEKFWICGAGLWKDANFPGGNTDWYPPFVPAPAGIGLDGGARVGDRAYSRNQTDKKCTTAGLPYAQVWS